MSKAKKLALTFLSVLFALTFMLGMVACGGQSAKSAIDAYLLPQDNALVEQDFTLPKKIGIDNGVEVKWTSDNAAITIEDGTADTYNAKVTMQDEVTPVKLTISSGGASKDFNVRVDALNVFTFMKWYGNDDYDAASFPQRKTAQSADFALDSSYTIQGKTATITWSVESAKDQNYLNVQTAEGVQTAKVFPGDDIVTAKLKATFTYGTGDPAPTASKEFDISVSPVLHHRQNVTKMYSEASFPIEFDGYVVHVYVAEDSEQYGPMATFYAIDNDFCSGYYIWQAKLESAADVAKVVPGAHFTFSGDVSKNYNGLWETNGYEKGTAVFDGAAPINVDEHIRAMDTDIIAGVQSAQWQMSSLVSLTGWQVSVKAAEDSSKNVNLTLKNGDATVYVYTSTYVTTDDDAMTALKAKLNGLEVGDVINIKGLLGYNNSGSTFNTKYFRIQPRTADDVVVDTEKTTFVTPENAAKVKAAQTAVNNKVAEYFGAIIMQDKPNCVMPASESGVTISYELARASAEGAATVLDGATFSVTPKTAEQNNLIQVTYTIGDYKAYSTFTIRSWLAGEKDIVDEVYNALIAQRISQITTAGEVDLPTTELFGATLTWSFAEGYVRPEWVDIVDNTKLVIDYLPMEAATVRLSVHIACGSSEKDLTFNAKVSATPTTTFSAIEEAEAGTYKLAMYSANKGETYYATGAMDGYYFATTTDMSKAADFVIAQNGTANQYTIKVNGKFLEFAPRASKTAGVDIKMNDTQTAGKYWQWIEGIQNFVFESAYNKDGKPEATDTQLYFFGTYSTYTTMSGTDIGKIADPGTEAGTYTPNDTEGVSQWVAHFGVMVKATNESRAKEIIAKCTPAQTMFSAPTTVTLFNTHQYDAVVTYTLSSPATQTNIDLDDTAKTLTITLPTSGEVTATLHVSVTVGTGDDAHTEVNDYTITAKALELDGAGTAESPLTVGDALLIGTTLSSNQYYQGAGTSALQVWIEGFVTDIGTVNENTNKTDTYGLKNVKIAATKGGTDKLLVYNINWGDAMTKPATKPTESVLQVDDKIVVKGYVKNYQGTIEVDKSGSTYPTITTWTHPTSKTFTPVETTAPTAGQYYIGMQAKGTWYYLTGVATSTEYRLATTDDPDEAAEFTLATVTGGYTLKWRNKWLDIKNNGGHVNSLYLREHDANCVWVWESAQSTFSVTVGTTKYFLGSYGDWTANMSASEFGYLDGTKTTSSAQYPARIGTFSEMSAQDQINEALRAAKETLEKITVYDGITTITPPASTVSGVTLSYKVGSTDLSAYTFVHGTEDTTVTITITATIDGGSGSPTSDTTTATVKVGQQLTAGTGTLVLQNSNLGKADGATADSGYAAYTGKRTVNGYTVVTSQIMLNTQNVATGEGDGFPTLQFKANEGKIIVKGNFTTITLKVVSTYGATEARNVYTVKANGVELASQVSSENTGKHSGNFEYQIHTFTFTVTGTGAQTISVEKLSANAGYVQSITFTAAT